MKNKLISICISMLLFATVTSVAVNLNNNIDSDNTRFRGLVIEWFHEFGEEIPKDQGHSVRQTSDGGYITTGYTKSFGGGEQVWLIKTDSDGNKEWNKTFGAGNNDIGYSVRQTSDGGYIITGSTESYTSEKAIWLIKTYPNGTMEWNQVFGGEDDIGGEGRSVQQTSDGGYILTGIMSTGDGEFNTGACLIKTHPNGTIEWNQSFSGPGMYTFYNGHSIQQTDDDGYIVSVEKRSYDVPEENGAFLYKTDVNGIEEWNQELSSSGGDKGKSVQQTDDGGYIVTGGKGNRVWLIKTNSTGIQEWENIWVSLINFEGKEVDQTNDGGYILVNGLQYVGSSGIWLIKTNATGIEEWKQEFIPDANIEYYYGSSIQQTADSGFIVGGTTQDIEEGFDMLLLKIYPESIQNSPPGASIIYGPSGGFADHDISFNIVAEDPDDNDLTYLIDWGDNTSDEIGPFASGESFDIVHSWNVTDVYTMSVKAIDLYEEFSISTKTVNIIDIADNHPPDAPIITGPSEGLVDEDQTFSIVSDDQDGQFLTYTINWGDGTSDEIGPLESGTSFNIIHNWNETDTYHIMVYVTDMYAQSSSYHIITILQDYLPEPPEIDGPDEGVVNDSCPSFKISSEDPYGLDLTYYIDWGDGTSDERGPYSSGSLFYIDHIWNETGTFLITVTVRDTDGFENNNTATILITENHPPYFTVIQLPDTLLVGILGDIMICAQDPDYLHICTLHVDWGDETSDDYGPSYSCFQGVKHRWYESGNFVITFTVRDIYDAENSTTRTIKITNNPPNKPNKPSGPSEGEIGDEITFTSKSTDPNGHQIKYGWDWDGDYAVDDWTDLTSSGHTVEASHTWSEEGYYIVQVIAMDQYDGESAWSPPHIIHISEPEDPDPAILNIEDIFGGVKVVGMKIENIGESDASEFEYSISVQGGILGRIDVSVNGTIDTLDVGDEVYVQTGEDIKGLGIVTIDVTAGELEKTAVGLVFGKFVFVLGFTVG